MEINFDQFFMIFSSLIGFPALISMVVNVLKANGIIKDGEATRYIALGNAVIMLVLLGIYTGFPQVNLLDLDKIASALSTMIAFFVTGMGVSKITHVAIRGVPGIGKSFTLDRQNRKG